MLILSEINNDDSILWYKCQVLIIEVFISYLLHHPVDYLELIINYLIALFDRKLGFLFLGCCVDCFGPSKRSYGCLSNRQDIPMNNPHHI